LENKKILQEFYGIGSSVNSRQSQNIKVVSKPPKAWS